MSFRVNLLFISLLCTMLACSKSTIQADLATTPAGPGANDQFVSTVLSSPAYTNPGGARAYDLLKVQSGSKTPSYLQWIVNNTNTTAGAVIVFYPYEGIDWTGEAVDAKWAALGAGAHNDEDAPYYNAATSSQIGYTPMPHVTAADNQGFLTYNGLHVLIVYGRFYAGKTIADDTQAIVDAYRFLDSQSVVDKTKIGIFTGSWGGVGALYGTKAAALYNIKPKTISLAYPVSDAKALPQYINSIATIIPANIPKQTQYAAFFDPYQRRIDKATEALAGQATRYDNYSVAKLASIDSSIYIIHDDWDTLVPSSFTTNLYNTIASTEKYGYFQRHNSAIDFDTFDVNHSQPSAPIDYATALTWNYLFLIAELTDPAATRLSAFSQAVFVPRFQQMKAMYDLGKDTTSFRKSLGLLCRPNLFFLNQDNSATVSGSDFLYILMENLYQVGWSLDGPSACAKLIATPPF